MKWEESYQKDYHCSSFNTKFNNVGLFTTWNSKLFHIATVCGKEEYLNAFLEQVPSFGNNAYDLVVLRGLKISKYEFLSIFTIWLFTSW